MPTKPAKKTRNYNYKPAEIDAALAIFAMQSGRQATVVPMLEQAGLGHIPIETLRTWAYKRHKERYQQIAAEVEAHRRSQLADQHMRLAHMSADLAEEATRLLRDRLDNAEELETRELAKILREASNAAGLHTKGQQLLSGRPTAIVENRFEDIRRILAERHGIRVTVKGEPEHPALPTGADDPD
jgi:hypothetical protein